jgi:hypothetical protein
VPAAVPGPVVVRAPEHFQTDSVAAAARAREVAREDFPGLLVLARERAVPEDWAQAAAVALSTNRLVMRRYIRCPTPGATACIASLLDAFPLRTAHRLAAQKSAAATVQLACHARNSLF